MQKFQDNVTRPINNVLQIFPGATCTIVNTSGGSSQMYSDNGITPIASATSDSNGLVSFYANDGTYTLTATGGGGTATRTIQLSDEPSQASQIAAINATIVTLPHYSVDVNNNISGFIGSGILLSSARLKSALRPLVIGEEPSCMLVMGDSTGNETMEWVYLSASLLSSSYPKHTHDYFLWNDATQQYDSPTRLTTGTAGAAYISTANFSSSWFLQVADTTATSPLGNIDVRVKVNLGGGFSASGSLASKFGAAGNRTWRFEVNSNQSLYFETSADGTTLLGNTSSILLSGAQLNTDIWLRATLQVNNGSAGRTCTFYTSPDNSTWTQFGTAIITGGVTTLFDSTSTTQFIGRGAGSIPQQTNAIKFFECEVYASLDGTNRIVDIDVGSIPFTTTVTSTIFNDDLGNVVTCTLNTSSGSFGGSPRFVTFNSSTSGQVISYSYDATRYLKQAVNTPKLAFINYSHNEGNVMYPNSTLATLTDKLLVTNPNMCVAFMTQNHRLSIAGYVKEHAERCQQIADFSASKGFDLVDVYAVWQDALTDPADGIHPIKTSGTYYWYQQVAKYFGFTV